MLHSFLLTILFTLSTICFLLLSSVLLLYLFLNCLLCSHTLCSISVVLLHSSLLTIIFTLALYFYFFLWTLYCSTFLFLVIVFYIFSHFWHYFTGVILHLSQLRNIPSSTFFFSFFFLVLSSVLLLYPSILDRLPCIHTLIFSGGKLCILPHYIIHSSTIFSLLLNSVSLLHTIRIHTFCCSLALHLFFVSL